MSNNLAPITEGLVALAENSHDESSRGDLLRSAALALELLIEITLQIAPPGTDARFDAWCEQYLNHKPTKECPSDPDEHYHIGHI